MDNPGNPKHLSIGQVSNLSRVGSCTARNLIRDFHAERDQALSQLYCNLLRPYFLEMSKSHVRK